MEKLGRILVVEDAPAIADVLHGYLTLAGYQVISASDGLTALARIADSNPDLVLTDVLMPNLSGTELAHRLRGSSDHSRTPVLLFTGLPADNPDIAGALSLPLVRMVQKGNPFRLLVQAIDDLLTEAAAQDHSLVT
ncbi:MAG TPA: response regulator [Candidatus Dormibacteraeota bacterium]|jgi:CheY-like chemotaxis protein|nr:response regulator [Candidatus Dormibacteraeota bacterium]